MTQRYLKILASHKQEGYQNLDKASNNDSGIGFILLILIIIFVTGVILIRKK